MKHVSRELSCIAKSLMANDVANIEGTYKNFTGTIDYEGNRAEVKDATFELLKRKGIIWKTGIWKDGVWKDGVWRGGNWLKGYWEDGTWEYGVWYGGTWESGKWKRGVWIEGKDKRGNKQITPPSEW